MPGIIKKGDRVLSNDAALYGAPINEMTLGTALSDQEPPNQFDGRVRVKWDSNEETNSHVMDIRKYYGGTAEAHQTDEEASDIAKLDEV